MKSETADSWRSDRQGKETPKFVLFMCPGETCTCMWSIVKFLIKLSRTKQAIGLLCNKQACSVSAIVIDCFGTATVGLYGWGVIKNKSGSIWHLCCDMRSYSGVDGTNALSLRNDCLLNDNHVPSTVASLAYKGWEQLQTMQGLWSVWKDSRTVVSVGHESLKMDSKRGVKTKFPDAEFFVKKAKFGLKWKKIPWNKTEQRLSSETIWYDFYYLDYSLIQHTDTQWNILCRYIISQSAWVVAIMISHPSFRI